MSFATLRSVPSAHGSHLGLWASCISARPVPVAGTDQGSRQSAMDRLSLCAVLQDYIQRLMAEKADLDKRFHGMKDELITRLQNACTQRDDARAQVSVGALMLVKSPAVHTVCNLLHTSEVRSFSAAWSGTALHLYWVSFLQAIR